MAEEIYIELNNKLLTEKKAALAVIAEALDFPEYFGCNLDALADCLSEVSVPVTFKFRRTWHQDEWFKAMKRVVREAAKENDCITVK